MVLYFISKQTNKKTNTKKTQSKNQHPKVSAIAVQCLYKHQGFINFSYIPLIMGLGGNSWPKLIKGMDIPQHVTSCSAVQALFLWWGMFFQSSCCSDTDGALVCWWNYWGTVHQFGLVFFSFIKISLSWPEFFLAFALPILFPIPLTGSNEQSGCMLNCWPGSTHHQVKSFSWGWDWDSSIIRCPQEITYVPRPIYEINSFFQLPCKNVHCSGFTLLHHHVGLLLSLKAKMS